MAPEPGPPSAAAAPWRSGPSAAGESGKGDSHQRQTEPPRAPRNCGVLDRSRHPYLLTGLYHAKERERRRVLDGHLHQVPDQPLVALEDDDVIRPRPPRELYGAALAVLEGRLARPLDQDLHRFADPRPVV